MSDWRPDQLLLIRVDGTTEPVTNDYEGIKEAVEHWIDFVQITIDVGFYIQDEGMLNNQPLNVPVSLLSGRALYGPAVLCRGNPDDEGDTVPPSKTTVQMAQTVALWWNNVVRAAVDVGQDPYAYPNPDTIPPPQIIELPRDWLQ